MKPLSPLQVWQPAWMVLVRAFRPEVHIMYTASLLTSSLTLVWARRSPAAVFSRLHHDLDSAVLVSSFPATVYGLFFSPLRLTHTLRGVVGARLLIGVWLLFDLVMNTAYLAAENSARAAPAYTQASVCSAIGRTLETKRPMNRRGQRGGLGTLQKIP